MPKFIQDLYKDLRDRRLLPAVALLLLGVVAVPIALSKSAEPAPPPAPAPVSAKVTAAEPAVLAQDVGIRNYRKRLEQFKSKNPFRQHFQLPVAASSALEGAPADGGVVGGSAAEASSIPAPSSTATPTGATTTPTSTEPSSGGGGQGTVIRPETRYFTLKAKVKFGVIGEEQKVTENLGRLDMLPGEKHPVVASLGATEDGKHIAFLVSTGVTSLNGDGRCIPSADACQFLTMRAGDVEKFVYKPDGATESIRYRLKLIDIHVVEISKPSGQGKLADAQDRLAVASHYLP